MSTLLTVEINTPSHQHCLAVKRDTPSRLHCWLWKVIHPHVHTLLVGKKIHPYVHTHIDCGNGNNISSTLLVVERDTPACSHPAGSGKGYTLTSTLTEHPHVHTVDLWKWIQPHVHTMLVMERDTPCCLHPAGGFWERKHSHDHTACVGKVCKIISKCRRKKIVLHRHFHQYSSESVRHRYSGVRVSPVPLVSD
jgi:hypothetical protein